MEYGVHMEYYHQALVLYNDNKVEITNNSLACIAYANKPF